MGDDGNIKRLCQLCREEMTDIHAEVAPGLDVYVCQTCLESAKENFIWICVNCGNVYIRPKALTIERLADPVLKEAYRQCENLQIIQGIDQCVECAPEEIVECVAAAKSEKSGGHC